MYKGPGPCSYSLIMCRLYLCKKSETILQNFFHIFESSIVCFPPSRLLFAFLCTFLRSAAIQLFAFLLSTFLQKSFRLPHNTEMALMGFLAQNMEIRHYFADILRTAAPLYLRSVKLSIMASQAQSGSYTGIETIFTNVIFSQPLRHFQRLPCDMEAKLCLRQNLAEILTNTTKAMLERSSSICLSLPLLTTFD